MAKGALLNLGLACFTSVRSFCGIQWGERKKREIAFSSFRFLHFCWAFLNLTFLKCQELSVLIKCKEPNEYNEQEVLELKEGRSLGKASQWRRRQALSWALQHKWSSEKVKAGGALQEGRREEEAGGTTRSCRSGGFRRVRV